jgi:hypothetical protein
MKKLAQYSVLAFSIFCSCEQSEIVKVNNENSIIAKVLVNTCGGTVIQFVSSQAGEEWVNNFENGEIYENVALTEDLITRGYKKGDTLKINYSLVEKLDGNYCTIGGLPNNIVKITIINN